MALNAQSGIEAVGPAPVMCPTCKTQMEFCDEDSFYECPQCKGQFWPRDAKMTCPGCGRPMKYVPPGYYRCSGCDSEFWPPESEEDDEEEPEPGRGSYAGLGLVYNREIKRGSRHSKSSSGRKRKKQKVGPRVISQRYILE